MTSEAFVINLVVSLYFGAGDVQDFRNRFCNPDFSTHEHLNQEVSNFEPRICLAQPGVRAFIVKCSLKFKTLMGQRANICSFAHP